MSKGFWAEIEDQLERLTAARTPADVLAVLNDHERYPLCAAYGPQRGQDGHAFFGGGGGDDTIITPLTENGWSVAWYRAHYYYALQAPEGEQGFIEYVEGDVYAHERLPRYLP